MRFMELLQNPSFQAFRSEVQDRLKDYQVTVNRDKDPVNIYRAQGAIEALDGVLELMIEPLEQKEEEAEED